MLVGSSMVVTRTVIAKEMGDSGSSMDQEDLSGVSCKLYAVRRERCTGIFTS